MALSPRDLEWAAGFLEGEGFFIKNHLHVGSNQKEREPLDRLQRYFGGRIHYHAGGGTYGIYRWDLYGPTAAGVMMTLYSLMTSRRKEQMTAALDAWRSRPYRRTSHRPKRHVGGYLTIVAAS